MASPCLIQCCCIGLRFCRYKLYPWIVLAVAPFNWLTASGVRRTREQVRYMQAISRIDFVGVYGLLNDLLW
ncbi:MAG: hypothetical protein KME07_03000 [Pegethrix bostrychoides GSE-TBD4-15B]|uniref:Uncharacterized protein n=1 Tax=Pegethrix bostrychoides GSE-TBD4-15B TaxID=2839662 RepID=A0A951P953_9CYAN|nr:hypothetical protein [Pegethrix bostrychoides GSE-TBD4-15B]